MSDQSTSPVAEKSGDKREKRQRRERKAKSENKTGRPSLDKQGKSPQIAFRVAGPIRKRAKEVATKEGLTVSQLGRKALKEYLAKQ